ncbi:hypothetical protein MMC25_004361 [Agyrium rufum]|nr:hypothetical protein [Agyrium rufum]
MALDECAPRLLCDKIKPLELKEKPLNREPDLKHLMSRFLTLNEAYDRNHGAIPTLDSKEHHVLIDGPYVSHPQSVSVDDLQRNFPQHEVTCTLACAGLRRHEMRTLLKEVEGIDWGSAAIMNCAWKGPRLKDVLRKAGVQWDGEDGEERHVAFASFQAVCEKEEWYGGSVPLARAMREDMDVILALEMNGQPLTPSHGFPVRVIIPGVAGARSVKWLDRITVQDTESPNFYQKHDYKILPPEAVDAEAAEKFWDVTPALQNMPINSIVASPIHRELISLKPSSKANEDAEVDKGMMEVNGFAVPAGSDGPVVKVEVSVNGGKTWTKADIIEHEKASKWTWVFWRAAVKVRKGSTLTVFSRATDKGGNMQPEKPEWNLRGVAYNGYGESRDVKIDS